MRKLLFFIALSIMTLIPVATSAEEIITDLNKKWTIKFNDFVDPTSVNDETVFIIDKYDQKFPVNLSIYENVIEVIPTESYINYWDYKLVVTSKIHNQKGVFLNTETVFPFTTSLPIEEMKKVDPIQPSEYINQALVTLSYDDGYTNWYYNSLPLHSKYNIPATYNIIAGKIYEGDPTYMNSGQIWVSHDLGIEIASHTFSHPFLTTLSEEEIHNEFVDSNHFLRDLVGEIETLAIPYSFYNEEIQEITKKYYKGVRVFDSETNRIDNYDPYWLKSFAIVNQTEFETIKEWIDLAIEERSWVIIMLHGITEEREEEYETTPEILQDILEYINSFDRDVLLPVTTNQGLDLTSHWTN